MNVTDAQHVCQAANSKLLYIENEADDICAYYAMTLSQKDDALVLFSGRYFSAVDEWGWCPNYSRGTSLEDGCVGMISNYENWISSADLEGNCMGGFIDTSGSKESENYVVNILVFDMLTSEIEHKTEIFRFKIFHSLYLR